MSTRSNKGIWLLLVEPLDWERVFHKSKRVVDTLQAVIGSVEIQASIDTIHPASCTPDVDRYCSTYFDRHYPTCVRQHYSQWYYSLQYCSSRKCSSSYCSSRHYSSRVGRYCSSPADRHCSSHADRHCSSPPIDTVHLPPIDTVHLPPIDTVHPNTVHRDTVHPVKNNTTCGETEKIEVLILKVDENRMLRDEEDEEYMIPIQLLDDIMAKRDEQHVSGELSRVEEAGTEDSTSTSTDGRTSTSTDGMTSTSIDGRTSTSPDATREKEKNDKWDRFLASLDEEYMIPIQLLDDIMAKRDEQHVSGELSRVEEVGTEDATSTSADITTSTSTDITTSMSIDVTTSSSIDDVNREVTMEDSLELEEWLQDMDQNSKKKLDDDQHTSRGDLETSKASIGQHQPDEINRQPPHIIDLHPPDIDRHL
ncbi:hypothetical protein F2Q70_00029402 [Brassica cretica]|uniref:Uncharacterized protein n=1 Tax=Brassica cretica TaxID=69181 RepID=A0A8S9FEV8_BRACR|nr:hypothetical protein F2Q70_00029402 [Brassica cretica]